MTDHISPIDRTARIDTTATTDTTAPADRAPDLMDTTPTGTAGAGTHGALPRPRIRVGAIVWGVLLCAVAGLTLWVATDPARERAFADWLEGLPEGAAGLLLLLILGALLLLWGALAAIRRFQERGNMQRL